MPRKHGKTPFLSMQHWNGNQCCVIDVETTGLDETRHEIVQICILPLDGWLQPYIKRGHMPFQIYMIPEYPEYYDPEAQKVTKLSLDYLQQHGFPQDVGFSLLEQWLEKFGLPLNKGGVNRCKIVPLGQNYGFDRGFIKQWVGSEFYDEWFHYHYKDTMVTAQYLNDRAAFHGEPVPYPKTNLQYLASRHGIQSRKAHDAISDCMTTAAVYKKMCEKGVIG